MPHNIPEPVKILRLFPESREVEVSLKSGGKTVWPLVRWFLWVSCGALCSDNMNFPTVESPRVKAFGDILFTMKV